MRRQWLLLQAAEGRPLSRSRVAGSTRLRTALRSSIAPKDDRSAAAPQREQTCQPSSLLRFSVTPECDRHPGLQALPPDRSGGCDPRSPPESDRHRPGDETPAGLVWLRSSITLEGDRHHQRVAALDTLRELRSSSPQRATATLVHPRLADALNVVAILARLEGDRHGVAFAAVGDADLVAILGRPEGQPPRRRRPGYRW